MVKGIGVTLSAALSITILAALFRSAGKKNYPRLMLYGSGSFVALGLSLTGVQWSEIAGASRFGLLLAVMTAGGAAKAAGQLLRIRAFGLGHGAVTYVLCQSAMVISFLFAVFVWNEPFTFLRASGIFLILLMYLMVSRLDRESRGTSEKSTGWLVITIFSLTLIGVCQILYMTPSHWPGWSDPGGLRVPLFTLAGSFGALSAAFAKKQNISLKVVLSALGIGLCMFINLRLLLAAVDILSPLKASGLVYPVATGASVVFFCLYSRFFLRETFSLRRWLGLASGTVGITLMSI